MNWIPVTRKISNAKTDMDLAILSSQSICRGVIKHYVRIKLMRIRAFCLNKMCDFGESILQIPKPPK